MSDGPRAVNPAGLGAPKGYSHGVLAPAASRILFVAGQIGWDGDQRLVAGGFVAQFEQALRNVLAVVREAGGGPESICRMTVYVVDKRRYSAALRDVGEAWRRVLGRQFPAMALVEVSGLLEPGAEVEIEATAAISASSASGGEPT
jgi:enamine deaminase RidA (YjgF/YER057c/UK114 family)